MNKYLISGLILLICTGSMARIKLDSEIDFSFEYNSNILLLSEDDKNEFLDNDKPDKYGIESLDDLIMSMTYSLKLNNKWLRGHTQIDEFILNFNKYSQNTVKDYGYAAFGIKQYFNRNLDLSLKYYYYPRLYLRKYMSEIGDEDIYRDFEYSKNYYSAVLNWDISDPLSLDFNFEYSQLFYNKWFTEYDADILTGNLFLDWSLTRNFIMQLRYGYRSSMAQAEDAYSCPEDIEVIKDASYLGNIFGCRLKIRRLIKNSTLNLGYQLSTRIYDSEFENDVYHDRRDDYIHTIEAGIYHKLGRNTSLLLKSRYGFRNTDSPFQYVIDDKEYSFWTTSLNIAYDIKLK